MINGPSPSLGRSPNIRSCDLIPSRWPTAHVHTLPSSSQLITHFLSATVNSTPTGAEAIDVLISLVSQTQPTRGERTVGDKREVLWKYVHASLLHMGMDFGEYRGALSSTLGDLFKQCVSTGPLLFSYLHAPGTFNTPLNTCDCLLGHLYGSHVFGRSSRTRILLTS
jgi:hypothetical protein